MVLVVLPLAGSCTKGVRGNGDGKGDPNRDGGSPTPVDVGCDFDEACGALEVCDLQTRACVAGLDCHDNPSACAFCGDSTIIPPLECGFTDGPAYCDASASVCRRQHLQCEPCSSSDACADAASGLASVCVDGFCASGCGACPAGYGCTGGGCVPLAGIAVCAGAIACRDGASCPDGQTCTGLGVCLAVCASDADCAQGSVCETAVGPREGQCIDACPLGDVRIEDGIEKVCHGDGRYNPRCPTPDATTGCAAGTVCDEAGICQRVGCATDNDCPLSHTYCDVGSASCLDGCNDVSDCGAFEDCVVTGGVGACVVAGCRNKDASCELGQWCCGSDVFDDPSTCPSGVDNGSCFAAPEPWCKTCANDDDCADLQNDPRASGFASFCYDLTDNDGQSIGKFCSFGCNSNAECPRGVDCLLDLPTPTDGVTTQGCMDALCPAIAAAR